MNKRSVYVILCPNSWSYTTDHLVLPVRTANNQYWIKLGVDDR
jgi:hypothetical protein